MSFSLLIESSEKKYDYTIVQGPPDERQQQQQQQLLLDEQLRREGPVLIGVGVDLIRLPVGFGLERAIE